MDQRINDIMTKLGIPTSDDDWYYVLVNPTIVKEGNRDTYSIIPLIDWIKEQHYFYWEYKWHTDREFSKWVKKGITLYSERKACFRFSNEDHALHFKMVWG